MVITKKVDESRGGVCIPLGRQGENNVRSIVFDISDFVEDLGSDGTVELIYQRLPEEVPYPITVTREGNTVTWLVSNTDTQYASGDGRAEIRYVVGEKRIKSKTYKTTVAEAVCEAGDPPDPYESWLETLTELGAETEQNAQAAAISAENAEDKAEEADTAATNAANCASEIENLTVTAESLPAGEEPTVVKTGGGGTPYNLAFGIPAGERGEQGADGQTGPAGKTAYASAQDGGYTGTEAQFNTDLAAVSRKADARLIKTAMDAVATANTEYYLGTQSAVSITLPSTATVGQLISVVFYSGATAATLSISGTTIGEVVVPAANQRVEVNMLYDGLYWAIVSNTMALPSIEE